jgi:hypothetical protein
LQHTVSTHITKIIPYLFIASLLSSCAIYKVPPNTPSATLIIHDQNIFSNNHRLSVYKDPVLCKDPQLLGDREFIFHGKGVKIQANKMITIMDYYSIVNYEPTVTIISFRPEANQHYVIMSSRIDKNTQVYKPNKIEMMFFISKETFKNGKYSYAPVPIKKRKLKWGYTFSNSGDCADRI